MSDLVVTQDIPFGSVYAYRKGDKITADAVKQNKWEDYVAGSGTKAAREALGEPEPEKTEPTVEPQSKKS